MRQWKRLSKDEMESVSKQFFKVLLTAKKTFLILSKTLS